MRGPTLFTGLGELQPCDLVRESVSMLIIPGTRHLPYTQEDPQLWDGPVSHKCYSNEWRVCCKWTRGRSAPKNGLANVNVLHYYNLLWFSCTGASCNGAVLYCTHGSTNCTMTLQHSSDLFSSLEATGLKPIPSSKPHEFWESLSPELNLVPWAQLYNQLTWTI
ncbi:hypothetical protein KIL84_018977 [Mauremys mutica]|uniref:Uncharacterized protein n=1 Tax=Mauremys mutica TaxID=74926 RepID=A0A9D3XUA6_9SAUR|nr:hypothetical protein KIL84_018977 [Mauremys mutica]